MAVDPRRLVGRAVGGALLAIAVYYALWGGEYSVFDLRRIAVRQRVEAAQIVETRSQVDSLDQLVERLEDDPAAIEAVARERFGMIRDGEILYRFADVEDDAPDTAAP